MEPPAFVFWKWKRERDRLARALDHQLDEVARIRDLWLVASDRLGPAIARARGLAISALDARAQLDAILFARVGRGLW